MKIYIKNQLNNGHAIEFCAGEREYKLGPEEEITIQVQEEDCIYLDVVHQD